MFRPLPDSKGCRGRPRRGPHRRGDDYVTKPFSLEEVVARLRDSYGARPLSPLDLNQYCGSATLAWTKTVHEVSPGRREIMLTATEFELLRYLMRNPKRVLSGHRSSTASGTTTSAGKQTS